MDNYKDHYWFVPVQNNSSDLTNEDQEKNISYPNKPTLSWNDLSGPHSGGRNPYPTQNKKTLLHFMGGN